jgi:hypothetical protein
VVELCVWMVCGLLCKLLAVNKGERKGGVRTSRATLPPNNHPAPRGLTAQLSTSSGSDHIRSIRQNFPVFYSFC